MAALSETSLSIEERTLLERFASELRSRPQDGHRKVVWLFGSRARTEEPREDSDVDVLVLTDDASWDNKLRIHDALQTAARALGLQALTWSFSIHINTPTWLEDRRRIHSFFIAEVDRDKISLPVAE
jgi:predicted nucleotidyltransferase